ncbi:MAG: antibiotic biosynthesis monooxygenase [Hyphomicrobiales bacterium]
MPYIRLSVARPIRGQEKRMEELMRRLADLIGESEGCLESYLLRPHDDSGEIARIAIYKDEESAEHAANNDTIMAIRSEMHLISEPGHIERAFFSI